MSVQQTEDGDFIVMGNTYSKGSGNDDIWVMKLDALGNKKWDKTLGGAKSEFASEMQLTKDGGYIIAGSTSSEGEGKSDFWVIKLNAEGN